MLLKLILIYKKFPMSKKRLLTAKWQAVQRLSNNPIYTNMCKRFFDGYEVKFGIMNKYYSYFGLYKVNI